MPLQKYDYRRHRVLTTACTIIMHPCASYFFMHYIGAIQEYCTEKVRLSRVVDATDAALGGISARQSGVAAIRIFHSWWHGTC
jgi:hypothetical protein